MSTDLVDFGKVVLDPTAFSRVILQNDPWAIQQKIFQSVATHPRTAVKACHSSGKSHTAAQLVLWWLARFHDGVVLTTAPVFTQVERVIWKEIHVAVGKALIKYPDPLKVELSLKKNNYALGLSTDEGIRFQGHHGKILVIFDEAVGVKPDIWEAVEGMRAGGDVRMLCLGNPTVAGGPFYDAFGVNRQFWNTFTINAFATPNFYGLMPKALHGVTRDLSDAEIQPALEKLLAMSEKELSKNPRPYLTTRQWVKEKYYEWGPGHPLWDSRVLGRFPGQSEQSLFALSWLEQAQHRILEPVTYKEIRIRGGLDVAGPGEDETVLTLRKGPQIILQKFYTDPDPRGKVLADLMPYRDDLEVLNVDCNGIGWYMARHLEDAKIPVIDVNVHNKPTTLSAQNSEKYADLKAEVYWSTRAALESGEVAGLKDEVTISQLASIQYDHDSRGRIRIESKEDARKRGVKSPDRAESVVLAFANVPKPQFFIGRL